MVTFGKELVVVYLGILLWRSDQV